MSPLRRIRSGLNDSSSTLSRIERLFLDIVIIRSMWQPFNMMPHPHVFLRHPLVVLGPSTTDLFVMHNVAMPSGSALVHTLTIARRAMPMLFTAMLGWGMLPIFVIAMQNALWPDLVGYDGRNANPRQETSSGFEKTVVVMIVTALLATRRRR